MDLSDLRDLKMIRMTAPSLPSIDRFRVSAPLSGNVANNVFGAISTLILQRDHFAVVFRDSNSPLRRAVEEPGIVVKPIKGDPALVAGFAFSSLGISLTHKLTQLFLNLALSGALPAFPLAFSRGSENNAQVTSAESAQTVLIEKAQATPETDRAPAFGERWGVAIRSMFKQENFDEG